ncbi:MAG: TlpA family protein disulfide reductase, partial [Castellaniella sp.]
IRFPVGIDRPAPSGNPIPLTMQAWGLQGTPSLVILDARGGVRLHHFGRLDDLKAGAVIGRLLAEADATAP